MCGSLGTGVEVGAGVEKCAGAGVDVAMCGCVVL